MYKSSISDPEKFWGKHGKRIDWIKPYTKVKETNFNAPNVSIEWFSDGTLNACVNCLDRHLYHRGGQIAIIWEGDDPSESKSITYLELFKEVCKFSNAMIERGIKKR